MACNFWSVGYCGEIPSNENGATLIEIVSVIKMMFKSLKGMNKLFFSCVVLVQIVSSLFAKHCEIIVKLNSKA